LNVIERTLGLEQDHIISTDLSPEACCQLFMQVSELAAVHSSTLCFLSFPLVHSLGHALGLSLTSEQSLTNLPSYVFP
jgi:hypothetical protein